MTTIGIDFDNTLIDYAGVFARLAAAKGWIAEGARLAKEGIKEKLVAEDGNDLRWQVLQSEAYSDAILDAPAFPGAIEAIQSLITSGERVVIISHKTAVSNLDPTRELRERAREWLGKNLACVPANAVFFESSREEKIERIRALGCQVFVDDLIEVLEHPAFPPETMRVWFAPSAQGAREGVTQVGSWREVAAYLDLHRQAGRGAFATVERATGSRPVAVEALKRSGNSRIYKVRLANGESCVLKRYFASGQERRDRAANEFKGLSALWDRGIRQIPRPIFHAQSDHYALYSFVPGRVLAPAEITPAHASAAADFLLALFQLGKTVPVDAVPPGVDGRACLNDYLSMIESRFRAIEGGLGAAPWGKEAKELLAKKLVPARDRILARFFRALPETGLDPAVPLPQKERILSPSDFGFHNALVEEGRNPVFVDFEYFGWDDPAKLVADFFHSVGQNLGWKEKWHFLDRFASGLGDGGSFQRRWELVIDLIGLEWILIVLNVLSPAVMKVRKFADPALIEAELVSARIKKAREMLEAIEKREREALQEPRFLTIPERAHGRD